MSMRIALWIFLFGFLLGGCASKEETANKKYNKINAVIVQAVEQRKNNPLKSIKLLQEGISAADKLVADYPNIRVAEELNSGAVKLNGYSLIYLKSIYIKDLKRETLIWGIKQSNKEALDYLSSIGVQLINSRDIGVSPMLVAGEFGDLKIIKYLSGKGINTNNIYFGNKLSMLHMACKRGNKNIAKYLIESGADVHEVTENGDTVLHFASKSGNLELIKYIFSQDKSLLFKPNHGGRLPVDYASNADSIKFFETELSKFKKNYNFFNVREKKGLIYVENFLSSEIKKLLGASRYEIEQQLNFRNKENVGNDNKIKYDLNYPFAYSFSFVRKNYPVPSDEFVPYVYNQLYFSKSTPRIIIEYKSINNEECAVAIAAAYYICTEFEDLRNFNYRTGSEELAYKNKKHIETLTNYYLLNNILNRKSGNRISGITYSGGNDKYLYSIKFEDWLNMQTISIQML